MTDIELDIDITQPLGSSGLAGDEDLIDYEDDYSHENISAIKRSDAPFPDEDSIGQINTDTIHAKPEIHGSLEEIDAGELGLDSTETGDAEALVGDEEGQLEFPYEQDQGKLETETLDQSSITVDTHDGNGSSHDEHQTTQHDSHNKVDNHDTSNEQYPHPSELDNADAEGYENHEVEDYDKDEDHSHDIGVEALAFGGDEPTSHDEGDADEHDLKGQSTNELDVHDDLMDEDHTHESRDHSHEQPEGDISDSGKMGSNDLDDEITWEDEEEAQAKEVVEEADISTEGLVPAEEHTAEGEQTQQSPTPHEGSESTTDETEAVETQQSNQEAGMDHDQLGTDNEGTEDENPEFPAVVVQYKGEEFPLFSPSSGGFFAEISILDDTIEGLLASFRTELSNELSTEDDLVFQIDELGLEYAESHPHDLLCTCTLRQILEIFDMLVKNQDPGGTRTLYTCLFTKPNPPKRWEALLESAASGQGLEEVMHIFNPRVPTSTEAEAWGGSEEYGLLDEYESVEDDQAEVTYEDTEEQNEEEIDIAEANHAQEEGGHPNSATGYIDAQEVEEPDRNTDNDDFEQSPVANQFDQPTVQATTNVPSTSNIESNSAVNATSHVEVIDQDEEVDFGLGDDAQVISQHIAEGEFDDEPSGSTTTNTLHADETEDQHVRFLEDQALQDENDDQYQVDLVEIDWNEAEENEIATGGESTTPSAKRSYPTDPQDADENSDAKRRRSS
ncbi:unnamed protein product [Clonostachys rhizophaga]|uniref:Uncharacterized protein n=1 Tax=Clonostachys rhizophaga TaxID=160324 RepID=A0A9N9YGE1_9HYPO|nr:unnamed protein product [Clonostachys rhizophaga]